MNKDNEVEVKEIFDMASMLKRVLDDRDIAVEIVRFFLDDAARQIIDLERAVEENNIMQIKIIGHKFKGAAGNISAERLRIAAYELEKAGVEEDADKCKISLKKLNEEYSIFKKVVEPFIG